MATKESTAAARRALAIIEGLHHEMLAQVARTNIGKSVDGTEATVARVGVDCLGQLVQALNDPAEIAAWSDAVEVRSLLALVEVTLLRLHEEGTPEPPPVWVVGMLDEARARLQPFTQPAREAGHG